MFFALQSLLFLNVFCRKKFLLYFLYLTIFLFCAFRYGQGPDYFSYENIFDSVSPNLLVEFWSPVKELENLEVGFRLINSVVKNLNGDYQTLLIIVSLIITFVVWKSGYEFSGNEYIFIFLFFSMFLLTWPYSGVRQGLTLVIGSYFINKAIARQISFLSFIFIVFILSTIHLSAFTLILFFLIGYFSFSRNQFLLFLIILLACSPLLNMLFLEFISGTIFGDRVLFYPVQEFKFNLKFFARFIIFVCVLCAYIYFFPKLNSFEKSLFQIVLMSFIVYLSFRSIEIVAAQVSIYGFYFICFLYSNIHGLSMNKKVRIFIFGILFILCFFWGYKDYVFMIKASENNMVFFDNINQFQGGFG